MEGEWNFAAMNNLTLGGWWKSRFYGTVSCVPVTCLGATQLSDQSPVFHMAG